MEIPTWLKWTAGLAGVVAVGAVILSVPMETSTTGSILPRPKAKVLTFSVVENDDGPGWQVLTLGWSGLDAHGNPRGVVQSASAIDDFKSRALAVKHANAKASSARTSQDYEVVRVLASKKQWADEEKRQARRA